MREGFVERSRPHMTILGMRIACEIKTTHTHSHFVIVIAFPEQKLLHKRALLLLYTCIVCLVITNA
jgi:hypothetical protein